MLKLELFQQLLIIATVLSTVTCAIVQKTKSLFKSSKYLPFYSFIINLIVSIIFCNTFTTVIFPTSLWVGLFSFLGADTIYKSLEGSLPSYNVIKGNDEISIKSKNIIDTDGDF